MSASVIDLKAARARKHAEDEREGRADDPEFCMDVLQAMITAYFQAMQNQLDKLRALRDA